MLRKAMRRHPPWKLLYPPLGIAPRQIYLPRHRHPRHQPPPTSSQASEPMRSIRARLLHLPGKHPSQWMANHLISRHKSGDSSLESGSHPVCLPMCRKHHLASWLPSTPAAPAPPPQEGPTAPSQAGESPLPAPSPAKPMPDKPDEHHESDATSPKATPSPSPKVTNSTYG